MLKSGEQAQVIVDVVVNRGQVLLVDVQGQGSPGISDRVHRRRNGRLQVRALDVLDVGFTVYVRDGSDLGLSIVTHQFSLDLKKRLAQRPGL